MEHGNLFERLRDTVRELICEDAAQTHAPTHLPTQPPRCTETVVGGVALPRLVLEQLQQLGVNLEAYSHGELSGAVEACAVDCRLIDDDEGVNFTDRLHLTDNERNARILRAEPLGMADVIGPHTHQLRAERVRSFAQSLSCPPALSF